MKKQTLKKITLLCFTLSLIISIIFGCKSYKQLGKEQNEPFSGKKFRSDKNYFRAVSNAISENSEFSEEKALLTAKEKLASNIQSTIKSVTDRYAHDIEVGKKSNFEQTVENETRSVVKLELNNVVEMDKQKFLQKDKQYNCYVAIEINKEDVFNKLNDRISNNTKLGVEYDKLKFKKIYDEEMQKLENEQPK